MKLLTTRDVDFSLGTLRPDERRRVRAWFTRLKNWDDDAQVRNDSRKLPQADTYVLPTGEDYWIFFRKEGDTITVADIARTETINLFAEAK